MTYLFHAFRNPWHLLLFAVGIFAGFLLNPLVFWPAFLAVDTVILLGLSTHKKFRRYVDALEGAESAALRLRAQRNAIAAGSRFYREKLRQLDFDLLQIRRNFASHASSQLVKDNSLSALAELEEQYIRLLYNLMKQREILEKGGDVEVLSEEIRRLEEEISATAPHLTEPKQVRLDILKKRRENAIHARRNCEFIEEQLKMLEESFRLVHEESLQASELDTIARHIAQTVTRLHVVNETLKQMERLPEFAMADEIASGRVRVN